jgi:hypothetical protein
MSNRSGLSNRLGSLLAPDRQKVTIARAAVEAREMIGPRQLGAMRPSRESCRLPSISRRKIILAIRCSSIC